jgi:hypothetical protein
MLVPAVKPYAVVLAAEPLTVLMTRSKTRQLVVTLSDGTVGIEQSWLGGM